MKLPATMVAALLATCATSVSAQSMTPREIAARSRPAVVVIRAMNSGDVVGQGSGFIVSADGTLVTNRHVIEDADRLQVELASGEVYDNVFLVSDDARRDLAILRIPAANLPTLPLADDQELAVGDAVYVMGNPLGLDGTFSNGLLSAKRTFEGVSLIQITAPISPGSSGGPVLNAQGEVVAVATLMMREGQNLNMAVPARYAAGLIAMNESPVAFSSVADRFVGSPSSLSASSRTRDDDDELPPWAESLAQEMGSVMAAADEHNMTLAAEAGLGIVKDGGWAEETFFFHPSVERMIAMMAVCDKDCGDVDIAVYDPQGVLLGRDDELNARAGVAFHVKRSGAYTVRVYMADCATPTCGYAVLPFSKP